MVLHYWSVTGDLMGCHAEPKVKHLACEHQILRFAQNDMYCFVCHRQLIWHYTKTSLFITFPLPHRLCEAAYLISRFLPVSLKKPLPVPPDFVIITLRFTIP
jgi:hypothetical protein